MTEVWKPVAGYEGLYEVSDQGRVRSFVVSRINGFREGPHLMRLNTRRRDGYQTVNLVSDGQVATKKVHQLVAVAFLGKRPSGNNPDHINGIRRDNRVENLRWATQKQNSWNTTTARSASGVVGVYVSKNGAKPWRACVMRNGRYVSVGTYWTIEEAKAARDAAASKMELAA